MKKLFVTVALLMGVSATNFVEAKNGLKIVDIAASTDVNITALAGLKFHLTSDNIQKKTYIALKDNNGTVLFSEYTSKAGSYSKLFDLSNLADGKYTFVVINGVEQVEKPFTISTNVNRSASL